MLFLAAIQCYVVRFIPIVEEYLDDYHQQKLGVPFEISSVTRHHLKHLFSHSYSICIQPGGSKNGSGRSLAQLPPLKSSL